jgi:NADPH-dependent 2,4-dienoyl-CoA reductase/sulfur reductase-like enzyme
MASGSAYLARRFPSSSILISPMAQVIVVGGGLAGLSAAHTLLERGANVLLLDKQPYVYPAEGG